MSSGKQNKYELDSGRDSDDEEVPQRKPDVPRPADVKPIDMEEEAPATKQSVHDLDVCPSCGAPMREPDTLVCLRCGFDLKTMKHVRTTVGTDEKPDDDESIVSTETLVQTGMGNLWLPATLAIISSLILAVCYLGGADGLFTNAAVGTTGEIAWSVRLLGLLRFIVLALMWTACGIGALGFLAFLSGAQLFAEVSDIKLAAIRMLAIVATMRLATLIDFPQQAAEWTVEVAIQAAVFLTLSWVLFQLKPRDLPSLGGAAVVLFIILWLGAKLVVWVTG